MFSVVEQFIAWMVIVACVLQIQAGRGCDIKGLESRLSDKLSLLVLQNEATISRLTKIESNQDSEQESTSQIYPPLHYVLKVDDLENDNWEMVFRATAGTGYNAYDAWISGKDVCGEKPTTMERSMSCHYRSNKVTQWSNLQIDQVKYAFYSQDREVAYVVFNGKDTSLFTWFDKSRVVSSSYSDLTSSNVFNIFSVSGDLRVNQLDRRFLINRVYGGCDKDIGHLVTVDTRTVANTACKWDKHVVYPQFLYSQINSADIWNDHHYGRAEYMAIFIKTQ